MLSMKNGYVYILSSQFGELYVGVTSNLKVRVWQHQNGIRSIYAHEHGCHRLIYYEVYDDIRTAIRREKQLKNWHRKWKLNLVRERNPTFKDLGDEVSQW